MLDGNTAALNQWEHEQLQRDRLADLEDVQDKRQAALDEAALNHDDPSLIAMLFDCVTGGEFHDAFVRQCQDVLETKEGDPLPVNSDFARAVREIGILWAGGEE